MPNYAYRAKNQAGETIAGMEFFEDEHKLAESLRARGLSLISAVVAPVFKRKITFGKVSVVDKLMFTRNLRIMINAGMPLTRVLEVLAGQVHSKKFAGAIREINDRVKRGSTLAESFSGYPKIFDEFFVSMIKTGESGSNLETTLSALEEQLRRDYELRSKIKGALIYPVVILSALAAVGSLIVFFVMPRLATAFSGLGVQMPFTLRIFIGLNKLLAADWQFVVLILAAAAVLARFLWKVRFLKKLRDEIYLNLPVLGNVSRELNTARFLRTFSSLITGGVPIYQALNITANTLGNSVFQQSLMSAAAAVQRGKFIHQSLDRKIWPQLAVEMVVVGEETGKLADISKQLAFFYEEEVANTVKNLSSLIEPVLMIIIGVAIGIFAVSVIQPIYSIVGQF